MQHWCLECYACMLLYLLRTSGTWVRQATTRYVLLQKTRVSTFLPRLTTLFDWPRLLVFPANFLQRFFGLAFFAARSFQRGWHTMFTTYYLSSTDSWQSCRAPLFWLSALWRSRSIAKTWHLLHSYTTMAASSLLGICLCVTLMLSVLPHLGQTSLPRGTHWCRSSQQVR